MQNWQKLTRWVMAMAFVIGAVAVAFTLKKRVTPQVQAPLTRTDEKAILESAGGHGKRTNKTNADFKIDWQNMLTYEDGSNKLIGLKVVTVRNGNQYGWSGEMHRNKGNILFSDGHVEELNSLPVVPPACSRYNPVFPKPLVRPSPKSVPKAVSRLSTRYTAYCVA